jgi:ketosteroid isomerase-like protein
VSQQNVEIARRMFEVGLGMFEEEAVAPGFLDAIDPDVEWLTLATIIEGTRYRGHDGVRQWIADVKRDWAVWEVRPDEFLDLGDAGVLILGSWHARGHHGDAALDIQQAAWLLEFREEKIRRLQTFTERRKAFKAASLLSEENLEVVRRSIAAFNTRDYEALRTLNDAQITLDWSASRGLEAGIYEGIDEVLSYYRNFHEMFEEVRVEADRFIESGDSVVVPNTARLRGRDGVETVARSALVFEVRSGRIANIRLYQKTAEALEAAGLTE